MNTIALTDSISSGYYSLSGTGVKTGRTVSSAEMLKMASDGVLSDQIKDSTAAELIMSSEALRDELQKDPDLKRIREEVAILAKRDKDLENLEMMSRLPASKRPPEYGRSGIVYDITEKIKNASHRDVRKIQIGMLGAIAVAELALTMTCGPFTRAAIMPYALGAELLGGLAVIRYVPGLYDKYVIPGQAGKLAQAEIKKQHVDVQNSKKNAENILKDRENEIIGRYVKKVESLVPGLDADKAEQSIDEGTDYVDIGGVKVSKRVMNISSDWNIMQ